MNKIFTLVLLALVNSICLAEQNIPTVSNCDFLSNTGDVSRLSCGILQVPENHDKPNGRQISIAYVVVKSENTSTKEFPMIYFTGGPGGQALTNIQRSLDNPILKTRDLIYFDQRGIGKSSPLPDITTGLYGLFAENLTIADERKRIATLVQELRQACDEQGIEIEMYNSFQNAQDVGMLMDHLGYEKYNLRGGSYGTRLARFVVDYFPEKINSAIYESPAPYRNDYLTSRMEGYNDALRKVFNYCKQDKQCSAAYPGLEATYHKVLDRFAEEPLELKHNNAPFFLNAQDAIFLIRTLLYTSNSRQFVPRFIKALDNSNYNLIQQIVRGGTRSSGNMAMFLVAENYEEYDPKVTAEVLSSEYEKLDLLPYELPLFGSLYLGSANFLKSKATKQMKEYKISKVPSLIFINQYDPVTPPINASIFKSKMTNAHVFILDAGGHGGGDTDCKRSIMDVFMSSPNASLDTGCLKLFKQ